jgi:hypothetical protein
MTQDKGEGAAQHTNTYDTGLDRSAHNARAHVHAHTT